MTHDSFDRPALTEEVLDQLVWSTLTDTLLEFEDGYETAPRFARQMMSRFSIRLKADER